MPLLKKSNAVCLPAGYQAYSMVCSGRRSTYSESRALFCSSIMVLACMLSVRT
jgi:hypothetical protein